MNTNILAFGLSILSLIPGVGLIQLLPIGVALGLPPEVIIIGSSIIGTVKEVSAPQFSGNPALLSSVGNTDKGYTYKIIGLKVIACLIGIVIGLFAGNIIEVGNNLKLNSIYTIGFIAILFICIKEKGTALFYMAGIIFLFSLLKESSNSVGIVILTLSIFSRRARKEARRAAPTLLSINPFVSVISVITTLFLPGVSCSSVIYTLCENELIANITAISTDILAEGIGIGLSHNLIFSGKTLTGSYATEPISLALIAATLALSYIVARYSARFTSSIYNNSFYLSVGRVISLISLVYLIGTPSLLLPVLLTGYGLGLLQISSTTRGITFIGLIL